MPPIENAWAPLGTEPAVVASWLRDNADSTWPRRALFIPNKSQFGAQPAAVVAYGANHNIGTNRSPRVARGGPVFAHVPDLHLLEHAVRAADGQRLGVTANKEEEIAGWAAAVNAINLETGQRDPGVPAEIHEALDDLESAGYNGYHQRGAFFKTKFEPPIRDLIDAGYGYRFVAGYLLGLGSPAGRLGDDLRKIYR